MAGALAYSALVPLQPSGSLLRLHIGLLALSVFFACLPDVDMLFSLIFTGSIGTWHWGITHTLGFALSMAALSLLVVAPQRRLRIAALVFTATFSHVVIDWFTGPEAGWLPSLGLKGISPFYNEAISMPVTLFQGIQHRDGWTGWFSAENLSVALHELILFTPPTLLAFHVKYKKANLTEQAWNHH
jgi:membrane-bound metal-dependent hydrolase YbcI (DUF457 family)